ncbi:unnamed protein product [Linum trigynum]|uniref:Myb/SANT-like DNA-binding domain-containing protein n=2 Tax=Linum trigynum TaxID=586398 RepID=A0AAV2EKA9_9ROSI
MASNGRISVTVAAATAPPPPLALLPPPERDDSPPPSPVATNENVLALAAPRANNSGGGGGGGGREDCWSEGATAVLIEAWGERYVELSRGNLKQKHWKEVADIVSSREDYGKPAKTDIQCKNRIDTVKKKFKSEKAKIAAGAGPSKWGFYRRIEELIGANPKTASLTPKTTPHPGSVRSSGRLATDRRISSQPHQQFGKPPVKGSGSRSKRKGINNSQKLKIQFGKRSGKMRDFSSEDEEDEEEDEEEEEEEEGEEEVAFPDSDDSFPPENKKRRLTSQMQPRHQPHPNNLNGKAGSGAVAKEKKGGGWGSSIRMLTASILKLGEAYEQAEGAKLQQVVEMEKTRMKFAKELELQRMQFFMKTQMEISQLKHNSNNNNRRGSAAAAAGGGGGGGGGGGIETVAAAASAMAASSDHRPHIGHPHHEDEEDDHSVGGSGGKPMRVDSINSDSDN